MADKIAGLINKGWQCHGIIDGESNISFLSKMKGFEFCDFDQNGKLPDGQKAIWVHA